MSWSLCCSYFRDSPNFVINHTLGSIFAGMSTPSPVILIRLLKFQDSASSSQQAIEPPQHIAVTRVKAIAFLHMVILIYFLLFPMFIAWYSIISRQMSSMPPLSLEAPSPSASTELPKVGDSHFSEINCYLLTKTWLHLINMFQVLHTPKTISTSGLKVWITS